MLTFTGKGKASTCDGVTRRDFLQVGALGAIGLSLPQLMAARAAGAVKPGHDDRSCIMIFNLGAPSQHGPLGHEARRPGRDPRAVQADPDQRRRASRSPRSCPRHAKHRRQVLAGPVGATTAAAAVHDTGRQMMQTGRLFTGGVNTPHVGAVVSYLRGRKTDLPPFAVLPEPMGRGGGNMPNGQDARVPRQGARPVRAERRPVEARTSRSPTCCRPRRSATVRLDRRRKIRELVDDAVKQFEATENAALLDGNFQAAFRLMTSTQAREAFDLSKEPQQVRERYGMTRFGQSCLLARRLIESGRAVRDDQHVPDRVRRDHLGHPRLEAVHVDRGHEGHRLPDVRPGLQRADRRPRPARAAGHDAGLQPGRVRPHAAREPRRRARPLAAVLHRRLRRRRRQGGPGRRRAATRSARVPADRPVEPADIVATIYHSLGSTSRPTCPARPAGRSRWSTIGHREIQELF